MLTNPSGPSVSISLSISLLKAVTWITKEFFDLSNTKELYFLHAFWAFSLFFFDETTLNKANSLNKMFGSFLLKSATLCTGINFFNCSLICSITEGVPEVTIVILDICFFLSTSATANDSIL